MILGIQSPEIHVTQSDTQNEVKTTEIKKPVSKNYTSVNICEIFKQDKAKDHKSNSEIIGVINVDTAVTNVQETGSNPAVKNVYRLEKGDTKVRKLVHGYPGSNKPAIFPTDYWVQSLFRSKAGADAPLDYDSSRNSFVALVFFITFVMLVITAGLVTVVYKTTSLRKLFLSELRNFMMVVASVGMLFINYSMLCYAYARRLPCNFIVLILTAPNRLCYFHSCIDNTITNLPDSCILGCAVDHNGLANGYGGIFEDVCLDNVCCMSVIAALVTVTYSTDIILIALIATIVTVLGCMCLAYTPIDFTKWWLYIFVISLALMALSIIVSIITVLTNIRYKPLELAILYVGTATNVVVIIMEIQSILGGKTVELNEDDYAVGAYLLYTSILNLFLNILEIISPDLDDD